MYQRSITQFIESLCFNDGKMAFISGPRQCGKTTLSKMMIKSYGIGKYHNWDDVEFRRQWVKSPKSTAISTISKNPPVIVYDEIHKARYWKRTLKGIFDTLEAPNHIIVTGSAKLNIYKKGGDSLVGRYYHFRLHPFTLSEINQCDLISPSNLIPSIYNQSRRYKKRFQTDLESLMTFGGFPEPFILQNTKKARLWQKTRIERVIREDLRDLTRIPELSQIEMLASLLPDRVGSPLSIASLREDLEVSFDTVKRWMLNLRDLYYAFDVKPFQRNIKRSLKKEGKTYLWDYSEVKNEAARFENLIASHLLKTCDIYSDSGEGDFKLTYLRNKEKQEIDFLITWDNHPFLPIEVKLHSITPSSHWQKFLPQLKCPIAFQITRAPNVFNIHHIEKSKLIVISASRILPYLC